ncbi:MAG: DUF362 domain-containing protein [Actinomycetia bacterium]|nr:DUF362 domain-containing protein [Actinomycetes bacterium]
MTDIDRRQFIVSGIGASALLLGVSSLSACSSPAADSAGSAETSSSATATSVASPFGLPAVYLTSDISPAGLVAAYEALGVTLPGKVAVKISTGEPGGNNFLHPELIGDLVSKLQGTIVECSTAYQGKRSTAAGSKKVAADHGFTAIAPVDIQDADGEMTLPVRGGAHLDVNRVGASFKVYDSYLALSHFKGHSIAGLGGALKNIGIGLASARGKGLIHSGGTKFSGLSSGAKQDTFLEAMTEAAGSVIDHLGNNIVYVNVAYRLSVDCDCDSHPASPTMADIGVLSSRDPVALDQACVDLVKAAPDGADLVGRITSRNGLHALAYAEKLGLGSRKYQLLRI